MMIYRDKGSITSLALVFGFIFVLLLAGLTSLVLTQLRQTNQRVAWNQSLHIAEAGAEYYRWCLNNNVLGSCDFTQDYKDTGGTTMGNFTVTANTFSTCGITTQHDVTSLANAVTFTSEDREVEALYAEASVGKFAFLINDNVWAGSDRTIRGLYHSNGGIRMDGTNLSLVSSTQEDWICTSSFGCSSCPTSLGCSVQGSNCECPGVFGGGSGSNLWEYPVANFDFDGITVNLASLKNLAQTNPDGIYLPPSTDIDPSGLGYHVLLQSDGTFDVRIITDLDATWAYSQEEGWHNDYFSIDDEYAYQSYTIEAGCPVIFIEDDIWIEGTLQGHATITSADLINPTGDTSIVLPDSITYTTQDGSDALTLIGEENVLISPDSPDTMYLNGIFIAQQGRFGRNHYPDNFGDYLEINGTIVSNGRVGTKWSSGSVVVSGFLDREAFFDEDLIYNPPPFTPTVSDQFDLLRWQETP